MCCSEGGCGINAIYVSIAITVARIESIKIPIDPIISVIPAESDTPGLIGNTAGTQVTIGDAEFEVIKDIWDREDESPTLSDIMQDIRDANCTISVRNNPNPTGEYDFGSISFDETNGQLDPNQVIVLGVSRETIMKKAEEWGTTSDEILAEVVIHEILHVGLGQAASNHFPLNGVGPSPSYPNNDIYNPPSGSAWEDFDMGDQQREIFRDLYDGKEPPGYLEVQGASGGTPPVDINNIRNDPAFNDYYEGLWNTLNATIAYPTFDVYWEGEATP